MRKKIIVLALYQAQKVIIPCVFQKSHTILLKISIREKKIRSLGVEKFFGGFFFSLEFFLQIKRSHKINKIELIE